jgi:hypothetical protein
MAKTTHAAPETEAPPIPSFEPKATVSSNGEAPPLLEIPPPDAKVKVSKYARFMASEQVLASTEETSHTCAYGPPPKTAFVRAHPDRSLRIPLLTVVHEVGTKKVHYLLDDALQADSDLEGMTKLVLAVPYITHHQPPKLGIWPISIEHDKNPWIQGALNIIDQITIKWLRMVPIPKRSEYVTKPSTAEFPEPDWSKVPPVIDTWLDMAFGQADWITPENWTDHPLRKLLREG